MRVLSIVHQTDAAAGVFADAVVESGHEHDEWLISESPEPPSPVESYGAVLVFGGAMHVDQEDRHGWLREERQLLQELVADDVPVLGVCLGGQLLAQAMGAEVRRSETEIGWWPMEKRPEADRSPAGRCCW